jgi:hypothetical protein
LTLSKLPQLGHSIIWVFDGVMGWDGMGCDDSKTFTFMVSSGFDSVGLWDDSVIIWDDSGIIWDEFIKYSLEFGNCAI